MREAERHPVFEFIVFGLALVLAGVLAFFAWGRFHTARRANARMESNGGAVTEPPEEDPSPSGGLIHSGTLRGVPSLPPVQGSPRPPKKRSL
jgi:hypothetical protein